MWNELPVEKREEYKKMILAFSSLSELFCQKSEDLAPILNSKYQETMFARIFDATVEDIDNTSFDASLESNDIKYLVGIKTFGYTSGYQKVAQFKRDSVGWNDLITEIEQNSVSADGEALSKEQINRNNHDRYRDLCLRIAQIRNRRIDSSISNLRGFNILADDNVEAVYHVLMTSPKNTEPKIYVGETDYNKIDIDNISILGCTTKNNPANINFSDGAHNYRYTHADSQLLMDFDNRNIVKEDWDVEYVEDAYTVFANINVDTVRTQDITNRLESYSWRFTDENGEVELLSSFNSFYGVGSKVSLPDRQRIVNNFSERFSDIIPTNDFPSIFRMFSNFILERANTATEKLAKVMVRSNLIDYARRTNNQELLDYFHSKLYRPQNEVYIPIPNSRAFHEEHPDFFGAGLVRYKDEKHNLDGTKEERSFELVFEPSGERITAFICQTNGKGIQSLNKQSILGEWLLRHVFQLEPYEPLTGQRLAELEINGMRLTKYDDGTVHLEFIWIDDDNLPDDYWQ